ncbi:hypothetical protein QEN19_000147 [Hanseniaspora menglaensis]
MNISAVEHSLENIKKEISSLTNSNALSSQNLTDLKQMDLLVEKIINDYHENQHVQEGENEYAEVLYDFDPQQNGDLGLKKGDKIIILEKLSQDWFKGKDKDNKEGVFPANYVKVLEGNKEANRPLPPPPPSYNSSNTLPVTNTGSNSSYYQQPIPQQQEQQVYQQQTAPFPPASTNYYQQQQPVQQQQQPTQQQQQQQSNQPSKFGNIGSKLGNAFVFGAGATLGGDLVNSIF